MAVNPQAEQYREQRRVAGAIAAGLGPLGLSDISDPRVARQVKRPLVQMLTATLFGIAARCMSLADLERRTRHLSPALRPRLRLFGALPDTTAREVIVRLDPDELRAVLHRQVRAAHRSKQLAATTLPFGQCAIDGKVTTTRCPKGPFAQHQGERAVLRTMSCALVSGQATALLDAVPIPAETNEMGVFPAVLEALKQAYGSIDLFRLVSVDAGMTSRDNAGAVVSHGFDYLMALKDTQRVLADEADRLIGPRVAGPPAAQTVDREDNDTTTTRSVWLSSEGAGFHDWAHLRTMVRVRSERRRDDGKVLSVENRFFVSSLAEDDLTPAQWLAAVRAHWRVENDVHGVLDRFYREDERPWLDDTAGQLVVALLRRIVLNLMALYRSVTRRGERKGNIPWAELMETVAALWHGATAAHLAGLRWPDEPVPRARGSGR